MGDRRILDDGCHDGLVEFTEYDHSTGKLIIGSVQDVEPVLEANKAKANASSRRHRSEVFNHVACIPLVVYLKWRNEEGIDVLDPDHAEAVRRKLNDSEYAYLRTKPGRV